jgi:uncharacterized protein YdhG (YjbR/CyaY superfamily)
MSNRTSDTTSAKASDVDEYLSRVPEDARAALVKLRKTIKAAVPKAATEVISYQIPAYKHHGLLVGFAASNGLCTFHIMSTGVTSAHAEELKGYKTGKASIRFAPNNPPPAALLKKLIKARIAENEAGRSYRDRKTE